MKRILQSGTVSGVEERLRGLFIRGLDGDAVAYRAFLDDLTGHLRGFLRKRIHYLQDDIEDIVQEILLAVHNSRHTYRPDEPLTAWVHAIARYKLMDFFRAHAGRESLNEPQDDHADIFAMSDYEPTEACRDVGKLLEHLPEKQRLLILHVKLQGLSVSETAQL